MSIFLSHTSLDKPVVEPIAIRLGEIFGRENVFYDAWSIQPGDGIIHKMNEGLSAPDVVFFFVSAASLSSKMVEMEWQNALFKSSRGKTRIIPVRVDGSPMPAILSQNLWIDLFAHGIEVAIQQMVNVIQGNNTFTPQHLGFSNLTYSVTPGSGRQVTIKISASHLMEPNPIFAVLVKNPQSDFGVQLNGGEPHRGGFNENGAMLDGNPINAFVIAPLGGAVTPSHPMFIHLEPKEGKTLELGGVMHQQAHDRWASIPRK